jgi:hypothetical protein
VQEDGTETEKEEALRKNGKLTYDGQKKQQQQEQDSNGDHGDPSD